MKNTFPSLVLVGACLICSVSRAAAPQTEDEKLTADLLSKDKLFWTAYNTCDIERFKDFFTDDVEFYHDKSGVTSGINSLTEVFKKNLCGGSGSRLRREAVAGTVKVFPLRKNNEIYGAIMSGEHVFYITENGKSEHLDGRANFTHLWLKKDGDFRMARILSYNHRPAAPERQASENK